MIDWMIHFVANGVYCENCGKQENSFMDYACNAHTHGMDKYQHPDFQIVIQYPAEEIGRILNTLGLRVQGGECFHAGQMITGIYEDCSIRLDEFEESGRMVLRAVIPDRYGRWPEEKECMDPYKIQLLPTDMLYKDSSMLKM